MPWARNESAEAVVFSVAKCHALGMISNSNRSFAIENLITAAQSGDLDKFLGDAYRELEDDGWTGLVDEAANAHSQRAFDLEAALGRLSRLAFVTRDFLEEVIPKLTIDLLGLLNIFVRLDEITDGQEMGWIKAKLFEDWCQTALDRPGIAITAIRNGDAPAELLRPALFAALKVDADRYLPRLLKLLRSERQSEVDAAAWTLGHNNNLSGQNLDAAVQHLEQSLVNTDGSIHAGSLGALIAIGVRDSKFEKAAIAAVERARLQSSPAVRAEAARELLGKVENVGASLIQSVFELLKETAPDEDSAIEAIDLIIYNCLSGAHAASVSVLLDQLLAERDIPLKRLDSASRALLTGDPARRDQTILRWLADGRHALVRAAHDLVSTSHGDPLRLDLDFSSSGLDGERAIAAARMITEALFIFPVTLASVLLSLLATGPREASSVIAQLLFDPLLTNYWVGPRKYLEDVQGKTDPRVSKIILSVLEAHDCYSTAVEAAYPIPELWPPERHRFLVALKESEERRAIARAAESQSVLMSLISKSVVLYGDAAIVGVHVEPGKIVRQESRMQSIEYSHEYPRLEGVDPIGQWYRREMLARGKDVS